MVRWVLGFALLACLSGPLAFAGLPEVLASLGRAIFPAALLLVVATLLVAGLWSR